MLRMYIHSCVYCQCLANIAYTCTLARESQLSADNICICCVPVVITNCSPLVVYADLHTPLLSILTSSKHDGPYVLTATCRAVAAWVRADLCYSAYSKAEKCRQRQRHSLKAETDGSSSSIEMLSWKKSTCFVAQHFKSFLLKRASMLARLLFLQVSYGVGLVWCGLHRVGAINHMCKHLTQCGV